MKKILIGDCNPYDLEAMADFSEKLEKFLKDGVDIELMQGELMDKNKWAIELTHEEEE